MKMEKLKISETLKIKIAALINEAYEEGLTAGKRHVELFTPAATLPTVNQQRATLIQQAKDFIEARKDSPITGKYYTIYTNIGSGQVHCNADFIVNAAKRTVVCLLRGYMYPKIFAKGIAKCHPDEVFNADIGKAIALARALNLPVPTIYFRAIQPTWATGQVMQYKGKEPKWYFEGVKRTIEYIDGTILRFKDGHTYILGASDEIALPTIIDDTEAVYAS